MSQIIWHPRIFGIPTTNFLGNIEPPQEIRYPPMPTKYGIPVYTLKLPLSGRLLSGHVCLPGATLRVANKAKRLQFAQDFLHEAATGFNDVVFTDETSIQLESHRRFCCRKRRQPPKTKPRYIYTRIGLGYYCLLSIIIMCLQKRACIYMYNYIVVKAR